MCMLSAVTSAPWSAELMTLQLILNSSGDKNNDGFGIFTSTNMVRSHNSASDVINLGTLASSLVRSNTALLGHVRAASPGIKRSKENSHPFVNKVAGIMLAHNGKLSPNEVPTWLSKKVEDEASVTLYNYSDSKLFLEELAITVMSQEIRDIPKALVETMKKFTGKFALIVTDMFSDSIFIAKGTTAPLHISYFNSGKDNSGFVINTDENQLKIAAFMLNNVRLARGGDAVHFSKITKLKNNTIFEIVGNELKELCEIKQNYAAISVYEWEGYYPGNRPQVKKNDKEDVVDEDYVKTLIQFMRRNLLSPADISYLFMLSFGMQLFEASADEVQIFVEDTLPEISVPPLADLRHIRKMLNGANSVPGGVYEVIAFPWFYEGNDQLMVDTIKAYTEPGK